MGSFVVLRRSAALIGLLAIAFAGLACKKKSESLILVGVTTTGSAPELRTLSIAIAPVSDPGATVTRAFPLANGLSATATTFGVYVSSDITGDINVRATAQDASRSCAGYLGSVGPKAQSGSVTMVDVRLEPGDVCGTGGTSGTGGAGGGSDAGASGGAGGSGGRGGADAGASGGTNGTVDAGGSSGSGGRGGSDGGASGGVTGSDASDAPVDVVDARDATDAGDAGGAGGAGLPPSLTHCSEYVHNFDPTAACVSGNAMTDVEITAVAFTPDSKYFFSAGNDARVKIWTWNGSSLTPEGTVLGALPGFTSLAVSADSKLLAVGAAGGQLNVWNVNIGGTWPLAGALTGIAGDVNEVAFGPDNTLYAIDNLKNFYVYTTADLAPRSTMVLGDFPFELAASPRASDGTYWVGIGYEGGNSSLLKVSGATLGAEIPFAVSPRVSGIYSIVFAPNGRLVASGSDDGSFGIWNVPLPSPPTPITPRVALSTDFVWNAAFHASSAYIAIAAGSTQATRQLAIWNVASGAMQSAVPLTSLSNQPRSVVFSPSGAALVSGERDCGKILVCVD